MDCLIYVLIVLIALKKMNDPLWLIVCIEVRAYQGGKGERAQSTKGLNSIECRQVLKDGLIYRR